MYVYTAKDVVNCKYATEENTVYIYIYIYIYIDGYIYIYIYLYHNNLYAFICENVRKYK